MKYLLDTNVLSEAVKEAPNPCVLSLLQRHQQRIATAAPVWHALHFGCQRLPPCRKREIITTYLNSVVKPTIPILAYDESAAEWHSTVRADLTSQGKMPAFVDGQIAAIAHVNGLILVTRNIDDFVVFPDLRLENWFEA